MTRKPSPSGAAGALSLLLLLSSLAGAPGPARAQSPQVDHATPRAQNGLTLLAIVRGDAQGQCRFPVPAGMDFLSGPVGNGDPGGIGLWVRGTTPKPPKIQTGGHGPRAFPFYQTGMPTAEGRTVNGETLPVRAERVYTPAYGMPTSGTSSTSLYLVTLPGGYPAGYGPIDITLTDPQGHRARWRITHLPPSYHAISRAAAHAAYSGAGVTLKAAAWQEGAPSFAESGFNVRGVHYQITGHAPSGSLWQVRITKCQLEWESLRPGEQVSRFRGYPPNFPTPALNSAFFGQMGAAMPRPYPAGYTPSLQGTIQTPYAAHDHYLRLEGQLVRMATATESVTFHNLNVRRSATPSSPFGSRGMSSPAYAPPPSYGIFARSQTVVTPSGISVTLLPLSALPSRPGFFGGYSGGIQMALKCSPSPQGMVPMSLPRSPLARRYHKPVSYTLQAARPFFLEMFPAGSFYGGPSPTASTGQTYIATLHEDMRPVPRKAPNGMTYYASEPSPPPKHIAGLTLPIEQRVDVRTIPISFLVPVQSQAPLSAHPPTFRPGPMPAPRPRPR